MTDDILAKKIGSRLKKARLSARPPLTQMQVGGLLGIGRAGYSNIENGRTLLTIEHLVKLPRILGKPIPWYLGFDDMDAQVDDILRVYAEGSSARTDRSMIDGMREVVDKFIQLSPDSRESVLKFVRGAYADELDAAIDSLTPGEKHRLLDRLNNRSGKTNR